MEMQVSGVYLGGRQDDDVGDGSFADLVTAMAAAPFAPARSRSPHSKDNEALLRAFGALLDTKGFSTKIDIDRLNLEIKHDHNHINERLDATDARVRALEETVELIQRRSTTTSPPSSPAPSSATSTATAASATRSWAEDASGTPAPSSSAASGRSSRSEGGWQPSMVLLRGWAPFGPPNSANIARAEHAELGQALREMLPEPFQAQREFLPPYLLNHQLAIRSRGRGGACRDVRDCTGEGIDNRHVEVRGVRRVPGTKGAGHRLLRRPAGLGGLDAGADYESRKRSLNVYFKGDFVLLGEASSAGCWIWRLAGKEFRRRAECADEAGAVGGEEEEDESHEAGRLAAVVRTTTAAPAATLTPSPAQAPAATSAQAQGAHQPAPPAMVVDSAPDVMCISESAPVVTPLGVDSGDADMAVDLTPTEMESQDAQPRPLNSWRRTSRRQPLAVWSWNLQRPSFEGLVAALELLESQAL